MRALTITQPWAGLVAAGIKLVENRPRRMIKPTDFGKPFAIHASREIDYAVFERIEEIASDLGDCTPYYGSCHLAGGHRGGHWTVGCCDGKLAPHAPLSWRALTDTTSAVIAVATIERDESTDVPPFLDLAPDQRRWFFGPIGYVLRDVRALATPVPCKGALGFWRLPADVERAVVEQLG